MPYSRVEHVLTEDTGGTITFRWTPADCVDPEPYDFSAATFEIEWLDLFANSIVFTTPSANIAGSAPRPAPAGNVAALLDAGSLAGRAGTYRLRLVEDPSGARNVFRADNLPVVRIDPAPTP